MTVNRSITFGMPQIKCVSIAVRAHGDAADIAISHSTYFKTAAASCFDIYASVEVISAQFCESAA
ncbi:MAG: Uncharacterised protein [Cryomorphaceae bacterium]|nr:MAG: Uncharacterised protein [Cryomorphaceae bacterium]